MNSARFVFSGYGPEPSTGYAVLADPGRLVLTDGPDNPSTSVTSAIEVAAAAARRAVHANPAATIFVWRNREGRAGELWSVTEQIGETSWRLEAEPDAALEDAIAALVEPRHTSMDRDTLKETWEGVVMEIGDETFVGLLVNVRAAFPKDEAAFGIESEVIFRLDEVAPEQRTEIREGSAFRWHVQAKDTPTGRTTTSTIELLPIPEPSSADRQAGQQLAHAMLARPLAP